MVVVKLYGVLEAAAQRTVHLHASTFDDVMQGLFANFPKLRSVLQKIRLSILVDGKCIQIEDCLRPLSFERIDLVPAIGGGGPAIMMVAGAALSYGASTIATFAFMNLGLSLAMTAALQTFMVNFGISMILGGISQALIKTPKTQTRPADAPSYIFNGAVNTSQQGNCVPVGFGRMRVGSVVISVNVQTFDIPVEPIDTEVTSSPLPPQVPESEGVPTSFSYSDGP